MMPVRMPAKRAHKYGAKRVVLPGGEVFRSQREYARWCQLNVMLQTGQIAGLCREVVFQLAPAVRVQGRKRPPLRYVADFVYSTADGRTVVEDAKGVRTEGYRIKRHLMAAVHGVEISEV